MPSGKVHDKITIATALVAGPALWMVWREALPVTAATVGYVFGGLWMSDDLDIRSVAYRRWGALRFLWWPYQKIVPHRSWYSHGIGIGPLLRVLYFAAVATLAAKGFLGLLDMWVIPLNRDHVLRKAAVWLLGLLSSHATLALWALAGLIGAGIVHSALDGVVSTAKKLW